MSARMAGFAFLLLSAQAAGEIHEPVAIFSFEDTSCGAWANSSGDKMSRAQYVYWFRGFVSGHNFANPSSQVALEQMPDPTTLALYIDKYCRDHPLNPFVSAAFDLVKELRPVKPAAASKPPRQK